MKKEFKYILLILLFSSCSTKTHVINEMDGEREIRWYSKECVNTHDLRTIHVNP